MVRLAGCGAWLVVAVTVSLSVSSAVRANGLPPGLIYGVGVDNKIYFVDTVAESITFVENSLSHGVKANGFATDRVRDQVFYFGSSGDLFFYDILSGTSGTVAPGSTFGIVDDFPPENATYHDGSFWYIAKGSTANNILYQAALTYTGSVPSFSGTPVEYQLTVNGSTTGMMFGDIVMNGTSHVLYGSTTPDSGGLFFSLDTSTLVAGTTNPVNVISSGNSVGLQLAFSQDYSVLYGQRYIFDPLDPTNPALTSGQWYTVNENTGSYAAIPGFVTTPGMRDLAGIAALPEPSTCLLAAAGVSAVVAWSRRRAGGTRR